MARPPIETWSRFDVESLRAMDVPGMIGDLCDWTQRLESLLQQAVDALDGAANIAHARGHELYPVPMKNWKLCEMAECKERRAVLTAAAEVNIVPR